MTTSLCAGSFPKTRRRFFFLFAQKLGKGSHDEKKNKGDDDKVKHESDKMAPSYNCPLFFCFFKAAGCDLGGERNEMIRKVEAPGGRSQQRGNNIGHQRGDDAAEGS